MYQNIIHFIFNFLRSMGEFANWLFQPLPFTADLGIMMNGRYLPPIMLEITPIELLSIGTIGFILVVHIIKLFDPFGG